MILFTIALPIEAKIIKQEIKNLSLKWFKTDILITWVWILNSVYTIKNYIQEYWKPDFIVNIWVCGQKNENESNFLQVYRIKNISNAKESLCPIYIKNLPLISIACSDKIITQSDEIWDENFVDMESFWIDFICDKEKIPYIIIKKPFDVISRNSLKVDKIELERCLSWFDYHSLIHQIQDFLSVNKKESFETVIQDFKKNYRLTFSEIEIFKKYINKQVAFWENQKQIFDFLWKLWKKQFIEIIKK